MKKKEAEAFNAITFKQFGRKSGVFLSQFHRRDTVHSKNFKQSHRNVLLKNIFNTFNKNSVQFSVIASLDKHLKQTFSPFFSVNSKREIELQ